MTKMQSFYPVHPGAVVKDELEARGISQKRLAELMGVPYTMLNEMLNGKRSISTDMALLFEAALEINAEMLVDMQSRYSLRVSRNNKTMMDRFNTIRKACAAVL